MHIVQIANFVKSDSGGIRRCLSQLQTEYRRRGHRVTTVLPRTNDHEPMADVATVNGAIVPFTGGYRAIVGRRPLRGLLESLRPDVVELSDKTTLAWVPEWLSAHDIPSIVISHERTDIVATRYAPAFVPISGLVSHFRTRVAHHADAIVCASQFAAAEFIESGVNTDRIRLVPLGVDLDAFQPSTDSPADNAPLEVVMCGRLSPEKQTIAAVRGFMRLLEHGPAHLTIIGDGPLRDDLESLAGGLPITFRGFINDTREIARTVAAADVAINLGPIETFGLATLEALACGVPVVVSREGGSREIIDTECGRAVTAEADDIANAIRDLASMPLTMRRRAARRRAEDFPWSATAESLLAIYSELRPHLTRAGLHA
jgi:alpha-1,6-mannosyltransferase